MNQDEQQEVVTKEQQHTKRAFGDTLGRVFDDLLATYNSRQTLDRKSAVLLIVIVVIVVALGLIYLWGRNASYNAPIVTPSELVVVVPTTESDIRTQPTDIDTVPATADVPDTIVALEKDLYSLDLDALDGELAALEAELSTLLGQ